MSLHSNHPYHIVHFSPWPLTSALRVISRIINFTLWFKYNKLNTFLLITRIILILLSIYQWWRDVSREGTFQGLHTFKVKINLQWGIILFIISEIFFFFSFFWTFFHIRLSPNIELGNTWPPLRIIAFNPFQVPLLNTLILLVSGISVTTTHHLILENKLSLRKKYLIITIFLGIYFSFLQIIEYKEANFTITDRSYGSIFFLSTGFHGIHVIIGTLFLIICLLRLKLKQFSITHHFGFEAAAWYWHFVDVVWIFLFSVIYWWFN